MKKPVKTSSSIMRLQKRRIVKAAAAAAKTTARIEQRRQLRNRDSGSVSAADNNNKEEDLTSSDSSSVTNTSQSPSRMGDKNSNSGSRENLTSPESDGLTHRRTSNRLRKPSWRVARTAAEAETDKVNGSPTRSSKKLSPLSAAGKMTESMRARRSSPAAASPSRSEVSASSGSENTKSERVLRKRVSNSSVANAATSSHEETRKVPKLVVNLRANNRMLEPPKLQRKPSPEPKPKEVALKVKTCLCEVDEHVEFMPNGMTDDDDKDMESENCSEWCKAIDIIADEGAVIKAGCTRPHHGDKLYRASSRTVFRKLCLSHFRRLRLHHCCPICGNFCTHGNGVMICKRGGTNKSENGAVHLFHKDCSVTCPHCGNEEGISEISLKLVGKYPPVFVPEMDSNVAEVFKQMNLASVPTKISLSENSQKCALSYFEDKFVGMHISDALKRAVDEYEKEGRKKVKDVHKLLEALEQQDLVQLMRCMVEELSADSILPTKNSDTPLHIATKNNDITMIHALIIASANPNVTNADGVTPIMHAVAMNRPEILLYLIISGADPTVQIPVSRYNILHIAARYGFLNCAKVIAESCPSLASMPDKDGLTPLMLAAKFGQAPVIQYILQNVDIANPHTVHDKQGNWALHLCAMNKDSVGAIAALTEDCPIESVNEKNNQGFTPLHLAVKNELDEAALALIAHGADANIPTNEGKSILEIASERLQKQLSMSMCISRLLFKDGKRVRVAITGDVARGKERVRIPWFTTGTETPELGDNFTYVLSYVYHKVQPDLTLRGESCSCSDPRLSCSSSRACCCVISVHPNYDMNKKLLCLLNNSNSNNGEITLPRVIYECSSLCRCTTSNCKNRVVQSGSEVPLQVYRDEKKGWAVRTMARIRKGGFVCEYVGEVITSVEAVKNRSEQSDYMFILYHDGVGGLSYILDSKHYGNVARFINHCCVGNLVPVPVLMGKYSDHRFPRIAFFAKVDILPGQELTYNYGDMFNVDKCFCGMEECRFK